ncbi:hypothetical protein [Streptomyces sp. NPDC085596]|uniref:hypothetical protein n=1 Tax=Streptomyces sp. NPDC085596 TaxID=3365731 RepID=UPI0037D8CD79
MATPTDLTTITGADAYAKAVEYIEVAARIADANPTVQNLTAVATTYALIAQAEATARASAHPGFFPGGGWDQHTHPNRNH